MSVQNVVLGELIRMNRRAYGYELCDRLRELASGVLGLSDSAIYVALKSLHERGLVDVAEPEERSSKDRRSADQRVYYEITDRGRGRYRQWMERTPKKAQLREELYLQLLTAEAQDVPELIDAFWSFEEQCRSQLDEIAALPLGTVAAETPCGQSFGAGMAQDGIVMHLQAAMEWAQCSRAALQVLHQTCTRP